MPTTTLAEYIPGPKRLVTCNTVPNICEPTGIQVDLDLLRSTLDVIYKIVKYSPLEYARNDKKLASISLSYPDDIPKKHIEKYGEFVAKFRITGNENEFIERGTTSKFMTNLDPLVSDSYIKIIADQVLEYHRTRFPGNTDFIGRIHSATLGPDAGLRLHRDKHCVMRYHIAINTNDFCFMGSIQDTNDEEIKMVHIPADGRIWLLDTLTFHNAMNMSPIWEFPPRVLARTHLIFTLCNEST